jgi:hypothetical protein
MSGEMTYHDGIRATEFAFETIRKGSRNTRLVGIEEGDSVTKGKDCRY